MPSADDLAALAARAAQGHADAFERLMEPMTARLHAFVVQRAGRALGADCGPEDVVQECLVKAWRLLPSLEWRGEEAFRGWLRSLAEGVVLDRVKYLAGKGRGDARHLESGVGEGGAPP